MEYPALIKEILEAYSLPLFGTHGITHWARVLENGLRIAKVTGANEKVVRLFAVLHDSRRLNESIDPGHGMRGAELAKDLRGSLFELSDQEFDLLFEACALHTDGKTESDITIQTCWDADRLDLGRVWIWPKPEQLCTELAKDPDIIAWANQRSETRYTPEFVYADWLVEGTLGK
jgi:uncharacterized protein